MKIHQTELEVVRGGALEINIISRKLSILLKTPTLEDAIALAALKHKGQTDKAGAPYILHPLRVMASLGRAATETERIAAVLHDVVEDCEVSFADLREMDFSEEVVAAVEALTKRADEKSDYMKAIRRVAQNSVARRVKIADLTDNLDSSRIAKPTEKDGARLEKYRAAREFLEELETVRAPKSLE